MASANAFFTFQTEWSISQLARGSCGQCIVMNYLQQTTALDQFHPFVYDVDRGIFEQI